MQEGLSSYEVHIIGLFHLNGLFLCAHDCISFYYIKQD